MHLPYGSLQGLVFDVIFDLPALCNPRDIASFVKFLFHPLLGVVDWFTRVFSVAIYHDSKMLVKGAQVNKFLNFHIVGTKVIK